MDRSFASPEENVVFDEHLLDQLESADSDKQASYLRIWESSTYFVVLGRSNRPEVELNMSACIRDAIPIIRRCSGGGTVLQGPGCLNYAVVLPFGFHPKLEKIDTTADFILSKIARSLCDTPLFRSGTISHPISVQGISDITLGNMKFSGNAQRRKRNGLLFHGTILYAFDLQLVSAYLAFPSKQPDYRQDRHHRDFVCNLPLDRQSIITALRNAWAC